MSNGQGQLVKSVKQTVKDLLDKNRPLLDAMLKGMMSTERFNYIALNTLSKPEKKLIACDPKSFVRACLQSAATGLEVDTPLQEATIIAYGREATFQPMYRGLVKLARQSGAVANIEARVVYKGDIFEVDYGIEKKLIHTPKFLSDDDPKDIVKAYSIARMMDGTTDFEVMTRDQIERVRATAKAQDSLMWKSFYEEGCKKTVMKRHTKRLPAGYALAVAVDLDNAAEAGKPQDLNLSPEMDISAFSAAEDLGPEEKRSTKAEDIRKKTERAKKADKAPSSDDRKKPTPNTDESPKAPEAAGDQGSGPDKGKAETKKTDPRNKYRSIFKCGCVVEDFTVPASCPDHPNQGCRTYEKIQA